MRDVEIGWIGRDGFDDTRVISGVKRRMPVKDPVYGVIPLGVNEPNGWLRVQIDLLCDGLTGHAEDLYKDEVEGE